MRPFITTTLTLLSAACTIEVPDIKFQVNLPGSIESQTSQASSLTDADCQQTALCRQYGVCTALDGVCVLGVRWDEECRELHGEDYLPCDDQGQCTALAGWCQATKVEDCNASAYCQNFGECQLKNGYCVLGATKDDDCDNPHGGRNVSQCKDFGRCSASLQSGKCVAVSNEDCQDSSVCADFGYCTLHNGQCVDSL